MNIIKFVDYTQKYGFAYSLSNQTMAVNFNDKSIMVLDKDCHHVDYLVRDPEDETKHISSCYTIVRYPKDLKKKVALL